MSKGKVRIIGGCWRSRTITFPNRTDLRPTPDRARETLFNWLGQELNGTYCLDLFAGSGALGFEAASRGAVQVVMVETDRIVFSALQDNKNKLCASAVELLQMPASVFLATDRRQFDIIFLDPPYRQVLLSELLPQLPKHLAKGGLVYIEDDHAWVPDAQWLVKRKGKVGKVNYQLLMLDYHG